MIRLILIAAIVCCIAYLSPTREQADVAAQVSSALGDVGSLASLASSAVGRRVIEEAVRRPRPPLAEIRADRLANAPERPYR